MYNFQISLVKISFAHQGKIKKSVYFSYRILNFTIINLIEFVRFISKKNLL